MLKAIRLSKELLEEIKQLQIIENRSFSNIVQTALLEYIKNHLKNE